MPTAAPAIIVSTHFESPAHDPLKLPRPIHLTATNQPFAVPKVDQRGGEIGDAVLYGLTAVYDDLPDITDRDQFVDRYTLIHECADMLVQGMTYTTDRYQGWHLVAAEDGDMATYAMTVSRVEVREA